MYSLGVVGEIVDHKNCFFFFYLADINSCINANTHNTGQTDNETQH